MHLVPLHHDEGSPRHSGAIHEEEAAFETAEQELVRRAPVQRTLVGLCTSNPVAP
jgi:hypothetical protein